MALGAELAGEEKGDRSEQKHRDRDQEDDQERRLIGFQETLL